MRFEASMWGKECRSRGNSKCKGPEAGTCLVVEEPHRSQENNMAKAELASDKRGRGSQGGNMEHIEDV